MHHLCVKQLVHLLNGAVQSKVLQTGKDKYPVDWIPLVLIGISAGVKTEENWIRELIFTICRSCRYYIPVQ